MNTRFAAIIMSVLIPLGLQAAQKEYGLTSPDGKLAVRVAVGERITFSVSHDGDTVLDESPVSMTLDDGTSYGINSGKARLRTRSVDQTVTSEYYKKSEIRDFYNEMTLTFRNFSLVFRAYNDGMAYRFASSSGKPFKVISEQAEFRFPSDMHAYIPYVRNFSGNGFEDQFFSSFENTYSYARLSEWDGRRLAFLPLVVEAAGGRKVCITEADLTDYPGMYLHNPDGGLTLKGVFAPVPDRIEAGGHHQLQGVVKSRKPYIAECRPDEVFPWRIVIISEEDRELLDSDMVFRLAAPQREDMDFSWVKPGKAAWEWWNGWNLYGVDFRTGINNETYKYYIDFAAEHGLEYVVMDEGWTVPGQHDLKKIVPEIDMKMLADYAAERNVGLILWAGYAAFASDMEEVCKYFSEMGIKGFKVDFMDRDDQEMVRFLGDAAETAARYRLLLDFHGVYKPTGLHRTYPNVVNYEGVHGLEQMKWSQADVDQVTYDVTVPFIRMLAGPMDYTQGAMRNASRGNYRPVDNEAMSQGTRCRQLAEYVIFESPFSMLCDSPSNYIREQECLEFISAVPEVWDETVALDGCIGDYIVMARRKGDVWYMAGMTDWSSRKVDVDLSFLGEGEYEIEMFSDGVNADKAARDYRRSIVRPDSGSHTVEMAPGGGFAARITAK